MTAKTRCALIVIAAISAGCVHHNPWRDSDIRLEFIGQVIFPSGYQYDDHEVGGLSGIDYDPINNRYVVISDDQAQHGPARFFHLQIDLADGALSPGDVVFTGVTHMLDQNDNPLAPFSVNPESIRFLPGPDQLAWTSEGTASGAPFVRIMQHDGHYVGEFAAPAKYLPAAQSGARRNKVFESLTLGANNQYLITATENALQQDGPNTSINSGSPARVLILDRQNGKTIAEYIYVTQPVAAVPTPVDAFATNGLVELLTLNNSDLLALERSYSNGIGNRIRLFITTTQRASNVRGLESIAEHDIRPMKKKLLLDLDDLGLPLDNIEGMTLGPVLADGSKTLILVSDNNFNPAGGQFTQFLAFKLRGL